MKTARAFLAAAFLMFGISAYSQAQDPQSWQVNVPFDFTVRHTSLEAGRYTVRQVGPVIIMTSWDGKTANVLTRPDYNSKPAAQSSLIFHHVDGEYDLAQITNEGSNTALDTIVHKHAAKRLEAANASQVVEVAALGNR